jgi:hypothetical protein
MITIKLQCACGQKYSFDAEPVNGMMPWTVACPVCGLDSTAVANQVIAQGLAAMATSPAAPVAPATPAAPAAAAGDSLVPPPPPPGAPGLRLRSAEPPEAPSLSAAPGSPQASLPRPAAGSESGSAGEKGKPWYAALAGILNFQSRRKK